MHTVYKPSIKSKKGWEISLLLSRLDTYEHRLCNALLYGLSIFSAFANDDTAVVRINSFALPSVGHVQTPFL